MNSAGAWDVDDQVEIEWWTKRELFTVNVNISMIVFTIYPGNDVVVNFGTTRTGIRG